MGRSILNICFSIIIRSILGFVMISSAILKFFSISSFVQEVQLYIDLYLLDFLHEWSLYIAVTVCVSELAIGILVLTGLYRMMVSMMLVAMFSFFLYLTSLNAFFPSEYYGSIESCGCFGELIHFTPMESFYKSLALWGMAVIQLTMTIKRNGLVILQN